MCNDIGDVISLKSTKMAGVWDEEEFEVTVPEPKAVLATSKWEGEDEDDDIKESWEDFDEEGKGKTASKRTEGDVTNVKRKRNIKEIIAQKEEKQRQEAEERRNREVPKVELTPEEQLAEKLRQQKLQEDSDLELAKETFGLTNNDSTKHGIESMNPTTREDFDTFRKALVETITKHEKSSFYASFLDDLFREICLTSEADDVKKLGNSLHVLANEKVKAAKAVKGKKKGGKSKASLVLGRPGDYEDNEDYIGNEYDDFM